MYYEWFGMFAGFAEEFLPWLADFFQAYIFDIDVGLIGFFPFFILFVLLILTSVITAIVRRFNSL